MRKGDKGAQFDFVWLFAIIAGGVILVLAIYGALQAGSSQRFITDTEVAKTISILTNPMQASFSEGSFGQILFKQETRINNICLDGGFGENKISVSTKSNVGEPWGIPGVETKVVNKYIFSTEKDSGEIYHVFSKPFYFPYKVADLTFITTENYCFINAPDKIADEVSNIKNINATGCNFENALRVCFGSGSTCDINVYGTCTGFCDTIFDEGTVSKKGSEMKYVGNLMYGAIFSDKTVYNCNVNRLMYRTGKIAEGLTSKSDLMNARNCNTNLKGEVASWSDRTINSTFENLLTLNYGNLDKRNDGEICGLWS